MMWQVRALLEDRPGAMAALARRCGDRCVNILGVQIFPAVDGRVLDELVLHTPGGWSSLDVEALCQEAGVTVHDVVPTSAKALEDQPVRYVRAARVVAEEPERLEEQLCRLLDASPAGDHADLVLDDEAGPAVRLARGLPFTDTEVARASELRGVAAGVPDGTPGEMPGEMPGDVGGDVLGRSAWEPVAPDAVTVRSGTTDDAVALVALHQRCSAETLFRRYHAPVSRISARFARTLLDPVDGLSVVAVAGDRVVGLGMLAAVSTGADVGVMVEDRWQRHGLGSRLLRALAEEAVAFGVREVTCLVQPDNPAMLSTVRRAGLQAHVRLTDGVAEYRIPVARAVEAARERRNRPAMGQITAPLVSLLHGRQELREVYPAADFIDQAVRGGA